VDSSITKEEQSMMMDVDSPNFPKTGEGAVRVVADGGDVRVGADGGTGKDKGM